MALFLKGLYEPYEYMIVEGMKGPWLRDNSSLFVPNGCTSLKQKQPFSSPYFFGDTDVSEIIGETKHEIPA